MNLEFSALQHEVYSIVNDPERYDVKNFEKWGRWADEMNVLVMKLANFADQCAKRSEDDNMKKQFTDYLMMKAVSGVKKSTEDPAKGKNWEDLRDVRIYQKCIGYMTLDTRFALRKTSRKSKQLVDETKFSLRQMSLIILDAFQVTFLADDDRQYTMKTNNLPLETVLESLNYILKNARELKRVDYRELWTPRESRDLMAKIFAVVANHGEFNFTALEAEVKTDPRVPRWFIEHCITDVKRVVLSGRGNLEMYKAFLEMPNFLNTSSIRLGLGEEGNDFILKMAKMWIKNNTATGKLIMCSGQNSLVETFATRYRHRIVSRTKYRNNHLEEIVKVVRIKTNDKDKHIVLCSHESEHTRFPHQKKKCKLVHVDTTDLDGESDEEDYHIVKRHEERNTQILAF